MALYPNCPPLPPGIWKSRPGTYLWSPSRQQVFLDDRAEFALQALAQSAGWDTNSPLGSTGTSSIIGTNLGLLIPWASNGMACIELTNTQSGVLYHLVSHPVLGDGVSCANWASEQLVTGAPHTNVTSTSVAMADRTNRFFWAYTGANWPTNAQGFLTLQGTNALGAYVNGVSNWCSACVATVVAIPGPVTSLNVGCDHWDGGSPQIPDFAPQNVAAITGLSDSLTTLCASHNPLASLDVHGLTGVQDIECYQCTNLTQVNVTHCSNLARACFEQCRVQGVLDFTGDVNLQDIRGAVNQYTNIIFGGAGPQIWHLCVHDNPQLGQNLVLTNFYSLQEWFMYYDSQTGAVTSATMPSTKLINVQIEGNHFEYADLSDRAGLYWLEAYENNLTNLVLSDCGALQWFDAHGNQFSTAVLDSILTNLRTTAGPYGYLDLSRNPQRPSAIGYAAADYLRTNLYWRVTPEGPGDGVPGDGNALTFVVWSNTTVNLTLQTNAPASIVWHRADGTTTVGATSISHTFQGAPGSYPACHTNFVTVTPTSALSYFGKQPGDSQGIIGVYGLSNFPSLYELYLYNDALQQLSLANCGSLRQLALGNNPVSSTVCDQWFIDMDKAVPNPVNPNDNVFYYPTASVTANSLAARASLTSKHWNLIAH